MEKMTFIAAVETALRDLATPGIDGWGICPVDDYFKRVQSSDHYGCRTETCAHNTHGGYAADYRLIPKEGTLSRLGEDGEDEYFLLALPCDTFRLYRVARPAHHHAYMDIIRPELVPAYLLAELGTKA